MDFSGDGELDKKEFRLALKNIGIIFDKNEISNLISIFDADGMLLTLWITTFSLGLRVNIFCFYITITGEGTIDLKEFCMICAVGKKIDGVESTNPKFVNYFDKIVPERFEIRQKRIEKEIEKLKNQSTCALNIQRVVFHFLVTHSNFISL